IRAGGTLPMRFTREAISVITTASQGLPGLINAICENALLAAHQRQDPEVGMHHVRKVLRDLDLQPPNMLPVAGANPGTSVVQVGRDTQQCVPVRRPVLALRWIEPERHRIVLPSLSLRIAARLGLGSIQWRRKEIGN